MARRVEWAEKVRLVDEELARMNRRVASAPPGEERDAIIRELYDLLFPDDGKPMDDY